MAGPLVPPIPPAVPRWGNAVSRAVGRAGLRAIGWRVVGELPNVPKMVAIGAPHTCTMDVFVGLFSMLALGVRIHWLGKHTIFWEPFGRVLRWLGGIPVDRTKPGGLVAQATQQVLAHDRFCLALAPEGTRRKVDRWKTGFYRIAHATAVPILPAAIDYRRRVVDVGLPLLPTGDYEADLAVLKSHFCAEMARHPERY